RELVEARRSDDEAGTLEMHDLIGAVRLLDASGLEPSIGDDLRVVLIPIAVDAVRAAAGGSGYGLTPLSVAPQPSSQLASVLDDEIGTQLDELIASQAEDGAWWPPWSWGEGTVAGDESRVAWAGVLTLDALRSLQAYGRIDRE